MPSAGDLAVRVLFSAGLSYQFGKLRVGCNAARSFLSSPSIQASEPSAPTNMLVYVLDAEYAATTNRSATNQRLQHVSPSSYSPGWPLGRWSHHEKHVYDPLPLVVDAPQPPSTRGPRIRLEQIELKKSASKREQRWQMRRKL